MDPFEKAIRGAFEKSDPSDVSVRKRVYRSAVNALERALQNNDNLTAEQTTARRSKLKALIQSIESEFAVAVPEPRSAINTQSAPTPTATITPATNTPATINKAAPRVTARQKSDAVPGQRVEPSFSSTEAVSDVPAAGIAEKPAKSNWAARIRTSNLRNEGKKKRWPKFVFNLAILLAIVFAGIFAVRWVLTTDLRQFASTNSNDGNLEFTSQAIGANQDQNWITIFDPSDVSTVRVGTGAQARLSADGRATYLQIASSTANSGIFFDVGLGVLQDFVGKEAIVVIRAKTASDEKSDMAVFCDFNGLGKCSRKRFTVTNEVQDFIFDFTFQNQSPRNGGAIEIISDIDGGGIPLNLVAIQIREKPVN